MEDLDEILSAYNPNRELDMTWLDCELEVLPERIHERIAINGKAFTLREIKYGIRAFADAFGKGSSVMKLMMKSLLIIIHIKDISMDMI